MHKTALPIGIDDFKKIITENYYYVDKTLFIKELIDYKGDVNLFTRPRRFGKTLNLSMLQYFFEKTVQENHYLFQNLAIMKEGERYLSEMGKYPVIKITLKSAKALIWADSLNNIKEELRREYRRHDYLLSGEKLPEYMKKSFYAIVDGSASDAEYSMSLVMLSECLYRYHGNKVIILIDEYDVPLENSYFMGFYKEMANFIRTLFEGALKSNSNLYFSVITGCLRITKESIFTGLNNLNMISILDYQYSEHFGFTEKEADNLIIYYDLERKARTIKNWYNGYLFGNTTVYNPWSLINYAAKSISEPDLLPSPYWSNTSSNDIIRTLIEMSDLSVRDEIEQLVMGNTITKPVHEDITYDEITTSLDNLWNFLFFTGYLKKVSETIRNRIKYLTLKIPNEEVLYIYENKIMAWFTENIKTKDLTRMYKAIAESDSETFQKELSALLGDTISYYDSHENYYHGFLSGALAMMKGYIIKSNREAGDGRSDIFMKPPSPDKAVIIIEIKVAANAAELSSKCEDALKQIDERNYAHDFFQEGYKDIIKYGVAFFKKRCMVHTKS